MEGLRGRIYLTQNGEKKKEGGSSPSQATRGKRGRWCGKTKKGITLNQAGEDEKCFIIKEMDESKWGRGDKVKNSHMLKKVFEYFQREGAIDKKGGGAYQKKEKASIAVEEKGRSSRSKERGLDRIMLQ